MSRHIIYPPQCLKPKFGGIVCERIEIRNIWKRLKEKTYQKSRILIDVGITTPKLVKVIISVFLKWKKKGVKYKQYEIWKGKQYKQPDGSIIHIKPCDKDFGIYGWYLCGCDIKNGLYRLKEQFEDFPYKQFLSAINN